MFRDGKLSRPRFDSIRDKHVPPAPSIRVLVMMPSRVFDLLFASSMILPFQQRRKFHPVRKKRIWTGLDRQPRFPIGPVVHDGPVEAFLNPPALVWPVDLDHGGGYASCSRSVDPRPAVQIDILLAPLLPARIIYSYSYSSSGKG